MIDVRPSSTLELHRTIEQCTTRFSPEDVEELLALIDGHLPFAPWQQEDEEEEEGAEGEEETGAVDGETTER